jgi:hypothetical protein
MIRVFGVPFDELPSGLSLRVEDRAGLRLRRLVRTIGQKRAPIDDIDVVNGLLWWGGGQIQNLDAQVGEALRLLAENLLEGVS